MNTLSILFLLITLASCILKESSTQKDPTDHPSWTKAFLMDERGNELTSLDFDYVINTNWPNTQTLNFRVRNDGVGPGPIFAYASNSSNGNFTVTQGDCDGLTDIPVGEYCSFSITFALSHMSGIGRMEGQLALMDYDGESIVFPITGEITDINY